MAFHSCNVARVRWHIIVIFIKRVIFVVVVVVIVRYLFIGFVIIIVIIVEEDFCVSISKSEGDVRRTRRARVWTRAMTSCGIESMVQWLRLKTRPKLGLY